MGLFGGKKKEVSNTAPTNQYRVGYGVYTLEENYLKFAMENKKGKVIGEETISYSRIEGVTHKSAGPGMKIVEIRVAGAKKAPVGCEFMYKTKKNGDETERFVSDLNNKLN